MNTNSYTISILDDYSKLDEIYRLTHDTLVVSGQISAQKNGTFITSPQLDHDTNTTIIIAENNHGIIGTISATIDSEAGLNTDSWFENDVNTFRKDNSCKLSSSWRLATAPSFRCTKSLIVDLIGSVLKLLLDAGCNTLFCVLLNKHIKFYQRLLKATVVSTKTVVLNDEITLELSLMKINIKEGLDNFKQLKQKQL